jgi:hypothetical protein
MSRIMGYKVGSGPFLRPSYQPVGWFVEGYDTGDTRYLFLNEILFCNDSMIFINLIKR